MNKTAATIKTITEEKLITDRLVQDSNSIVLEIHARIWDIMLLTPEKRDESMDYLDSLYQTFYDNLKELKKHKPVESHKKLDDLNYLFRYYIQYGSTILKFKDLQEFNNDNIAINRFKENKTYLTGLFSEIVDGSKHDFATSLASLNKNFRSLVLRTALLLAVVILIAVIYALILAGRLSGPIKYLTTLAEKAGNGDYTVRSLLKNSGEVRVLSDTFNSMLDQIQEYSTGMEELVQKRTTALQAAHDKMKQDLIIARKVQQAMIPRDFSEYPGYDFNGYYQPVDDLGGDFYDVIKLDENRVALLIADVCGHGVPAALVTALAKMAFLNFSKTGQSAARVMNNVNRELFKIIGNTSYLTAFYSIIDLRAKIIEYVSAAHPDIYILRSGGELLTLTSNNQPMVGFTDNVNYKSNRVPIKENDRLILYTDGILDARSKERRFFGEKRFERVIQSTISLDTKQTVLNIIKECKSFCKETVLNDDITLLVVDVIGVQDEEHMAINMETFIEKVRQEHLIIAKPPSLTSNKKMDDLLLQMHKAKKSLMDEDYREAIGLLESVDGKFPDDSENEIVKKLLGYAYYKIYDKKKKLGFPGEK